MKENNKMFRPDSNMLRGYGEVALYVPCSIRTAIRIVEKYNIPFSNPTPRVLLFNRKDIDAVMRKCRKRKK